jgi:hypothetical protein
MNTQSHIEKQNAAEPQLGGFLLIYIKGLQLCLG